jgi:thiol:disulfide interchange protein
MKKGVFFLVLAVAGIIVFGFTKKTPAEETNGIIFFKGSWKEAVQEAQKENKPIFLDVSASWCGPCKMLKLSTFTDKDAGSFYNKNFINISIDGEIGEGPQIAQELGLSGYPSLYFFDQNGNLLLYTMGYQKPAELIEAGKAALKKIK